MRQVRLGLRHCFNRHSRRKREAKRGSVVTRRSNPSESWCRDALRDVPALVQSGSYHCSNRNVHAGCITAARQDSNAHHRPLIWFPISMPRFPLEILGAGRGCTLGGEPVASPPTVARRNRRVLRRSAPRQVVWSCVPPPLAVRPTVLLTAERGILIWGARDGASASTLPEQRPPATRHR